MQSVENILNKKIYMYIQKITWKFICSMIAENFVEYHKFLVSILYNNFTIFIKMFSFSPNIFFSIKRDSFS